MQPKALIPSRFALSQILPAHWRGPLARVAITWGMLIILFLGDWADMAAQWWDSSTYTHILLIPAILIWLVKLRVKELAQLRPTSFWPGLVMLAGALFVWLLGNISGLNLASQLGAVMMLQAAVITLLGPRVSAALLFPLCYMLFLVPFGDELVPALQMITAEITIALTHLSGVSAEIEGVFINTPVGLFEVAEACSGVKFLVAMVALGSLVAHVCFRSLKRRIGFMTLAFVLPIVANGIRAWGTIFIAQSQGVEFAAGFDHIFYGWIFFALVMAILLGIGWRFFDRGPDEAFVDVPGIEKNRLFTRLSALQIKPWSACAVVLVLAIAASMWSTQARRTEAEMPAFIMLPNVDGWYRSNYNPDVWWEPRASGAQHRLLGSYRDEAGREVDVFVALYPAQDDGREAAGFGEGALIPDSDWRWMESGPPREGGLSEILQANGETRRHAVTYYRTADLLTGSKTRLKLANMADSLLLNEETTMLLIVSAEDDGVLTGDLAITQFLSSTGPMADWMDRIAQRP